MKFENVIIFGCGAVGSNILLNLIRDLPELNYTIVDFDKVEERNYRVGTQPYLKTHLGKYKTQALQMLCIMQANKRVNFVNGKIESLSKVLDIIDHGNGETQPTLVIDAFDKAEYRNMLGKIKRVEIPVIPGTKDEIIKLIAFVKDKIDFLNLNELEYSEINSWEYQKRDLTAKSELSYGIKGSEELALELLEQFPDMNILLINLNRL